ncbi:MAG TPA: hypothetical protein VGB26_06700 [Nitrospiria bacterium]|jgi:hypothetical protein
MLQMLLLLLLISASGAAYAEEGVYIHDGFLKGEQYLKLSETQQRGYAIGLVDGLFLSPLYGAPKARIAPFEKCVEGMSDTQVAAVLTKYLQDRPARWHESANAVFFGALKDACAIK